LFLLLDGLRHRNPCLWGGAMNTESCDGQRSELIRTEPYTRTDGSKTTLSVWQSDRPVCGEAFEIRSPKQARKFEPNRHRQKHKRPGVRVNRLREAGVRK
jgi:hypothetical protein